MANQGRPRSGSGGGGQVVCSRFKAGSVQSQPGQVTLLLRILLSFGPLGLLNEDAEAAARPQQLSSDAF